MVNVSVADLLAAGQTFQTIIALFLFLLNILMTKVTTRQHLSDTQYPKSRHNTHCSVNVQ